ncbi:ABC transporter permease [Bifidobacterium longum subsp. longum]|nr:ABC transporter permease [Bifidobacterium longum subsp. longum]
MLRIMKYLSKAEIGQMLIALVTIVGQVYFDLKLPDYMSDITTLVETPGSHMKDIWIAGGKMLLISLGSAACAIITGYIAARVAASFTQRLRSLEFRKVESFGPAEMSKFSTASLITRSTNDVTQVQMFITMGLQLIVKSPIMAVWAVCKIAGEGFEWTLATGIAVVILLAAIVIMMAMVMPKFKAMQALTDNINLVARENLTGLRVVRAYNAEDYQEAKFTKANKDLTDTQLFTNRVMAFMMPLMNTIMNGLMLAVYWIGTYLIDAAGLKDKLTVFSNMVVFSNYSVQVIMSFLLMSMVFVLWPRADVSAQRIMEVLDTEPIVENGTKTAADVAKTGQRGTVEFRNVSFTYPDSREAMLEGINFTAEQGQTVAFIGSTGSGKSSLINLVPRFYDTSQGQVLVDGVDVRDYDLKALRDKIGYVPQQSVLFKGTRGLQRELRRSAGRPGGGRDGRYLHPGRAQARGRVDRRWRGRGRCRYTGRAAESRQGRRRRGAGQRVRGAHGRRVFRRDRPRRIERVRRPEAAPVDCARGVPSPGNPDFRRLVLRARLQDRPRSARRARPRGQGFHQAHRGPAHRHHHERRPHRRARRRQGRGSGHAQGTARQLRRIPPDRRIPAQPVGAYGIGGRQR